jgi:hypothetical protein
MLNLQKTAIRAKIGDLRDFYENTIYSAKLAKKSLIC